jgi:very-short-patch-repair endonuclease
MIQNRNNNLSPLKERRRSLRNNMPKAEVLLWTRLKSKQLHGIKFRRQHSIGPYVLDFYCSTLKLAIEIDGDTHAGEQEAEKDRKRQRYIESFGIRFVRFTNFQVIENIESVLEEIVRHTSPNPSLAGGEFTPK